MLFHDTMIVGTLNYFKTRSVEKSYANFFG
jgi:hypothetical protein